MAINIATLAKHVNGNTEFIYPKTDAQVVMYDQTNGITVKQKIDSIVTDISSTLTNVTNGTGIAVSKSGSVVTVSTKLASATALSNPSVAATETSGRIYSIVPDSDGNLSVVVPWIAYNNATQSAAGLMSAADKTKLDGIEAGAEVNEDTFGTVKVGNVEIVSGDASDVLELAGSNVTLTPDTTSKKVTIGITKANVTTALGYTPPEQDNNTTYTLTQDSTDGHKITLTPSSGSPTTITIPDSDTTYNNATTSAAGLMSADDKTKLNGIQAGAQVNSITGVKGNAEETYRTGTVNLTPAHIGAVASSEKGVANGVATLDSTGKVPSSQLPSYVDDVIEAAGTSSFPATGESGKIYVDTTTNKTYRWGGSAYAEISASLALGETSSTAYRGDRGKAAYDHSLVTSGNPHNVTYSEVGLSKAVVGITRNNTTFTMTYKDGTTGTFDQKDTWIAMVGATSSANGTAGYVPAPSKDVYNTGFLRADGSWVAPPDTKYNNATQSAAGLMSAADKTKLDGIAPGATANVGTVTGVTAGVGLAGGTISTSGTLKVNLKTETKLTAASVAATETANKNYAVVMDKDGKLAVTVPWDNTTYSVATQSAAGLMSAADKTKVDNLLTVSSGVASLPSAVSSNVTLAGFVIYNEQYVTVSLDLLVSADLGNTKNFNVSFDIGEHSIFNVNDTTTLVSAGYTYNMTNLSLNVDDTEFQTICAPSVYTVKANGANAVTVAAPDGFYKDGVINIKFTKSLYA